MTADRDIECALARRIYRGEIPVGATLPTVRALAAEFDVTVPTIQRAVARLAATGLVVTRQGSGITVQDPLALGNLQVVGDLIEACADQPERVGPLLADYLELRRVLAAHLVRTRLPALLGALPAVVEAVTAAVEAEEPTEIAASDAALTRAVVEAAGNQAISTVFHAVEQLAVRVPAVAQALYGDREAHRAAVTGVVAAIAGAEGDAARAASGVEGALRTWDLGTIARFGRQGGVRRRL